MKVINGKKWYKPREIAKLGLITNSTGNDNEDGNYNFILELIRNDRLKAVNYSVGNKLAYYIVCETEIQEYHNNLLGVGDGKNKKG